MALRNLLAQDAKVALLFKKIAEMRERWAQEFQSWEEVHAQEPVQHDDDPYVTGNDNGSAASPTSGESRPQAKAKAETTTPEVAPSASKDPVNRGPQAMEEQLAGLEGIQGDEDKEKLLAVLAEIAQLENEGACKSQRSSR